MGLAKVNGREKCKTGCGSCDGSPEQQILDLSDVVLVR